MLACYREIHCLRASRLAALGDAALDALEFDIVGIVGLDVGSKAIQGALNSLLGGRVHHTGLCCKLATLNPVSRH